MSKVRIRRPRRLCPLCTERHPSGKKQYVAATRRGLCSRCGVTRLCSPAQAEAHTKYLADYRDHSGARVIKTCATMRDAEVERAKGIVQSDQAAPALVGYRNILVGAFQRAEDDDELYPVGYMAVVIERHETNVALGTLKPESFRIYTNHWRIHVARWLGALKVREVQLGHILGLAAALLDAGLGPATVRGVLSATRAFFACAVDDGLILRNPCDGAGRKLRLGKLRRAKAVHAMTDAQVDRFLDSTLACAPELYPFFFVQAWVGARIGEMGGLQWGDVDLENRILNIRRTWKTRHGKRKHKGPAPLPLPNGTTKSGKERTVDVSRELLDFLVDYRRAWRAHQLELGTPENPWVFPADETGEPRSAGSIGRQFKVVLRHAKLPLEWRPHTLRHTYAVRLLQSGAPVTYVQAQLGHATIRETVDTYGRWIPSKADVQYVDRLDRARPDHAMAVGESLTAWSRDQRTNGRAGAARPSPQVIDFIGAQSARVAEMAGDLKAE